MDNIGWGTFVWYVYYIVKTMRPFSIVMILYYTSLNDKQTV